MVRIKWYGQSNMNERAGRKNNEDDCRFRDGDSFINKINRRNMTNKFKIISV